jgi:hypothetical protein
MPALFTNTSMRPHFSTTICTISSTSVRCATSAKSAKASLPDEAISLSSLFSKARLCAPFRATFAPSRASSSATARPIPRLLPIPIATWLSSLPIRVNVTELRVFRTTEFLLCLARPTTQYAGVPELPIAQFLRGPQEAPQPFRSKVQRSTFSLKARSRDLERSPASLRAKSLRLSYRAF